MNDREKESLSDHERLKRDSYENTSPEKETKLGINGQARRKSISVLNSARSSNSSDNVKKLRVSRKNQEAGQLGSDGDYARGTEREIIRHYVRTLRISLADNQANFHESKESFSRIKDELQESISNL